MGLKVKVKKGLKRAIGHRAPLPTASYCHQTWSLDFIDDRLVDGRLIRMLLVIDHYTRQCLLLVVDTSISGARVARELESLIEKYDKPLAIVSDNGSEFTSHATRCELAPFLGPLVKRDFFLPVAWLHHFNQPIASYHQTSRSAIQAYQKR